MTDQLRRHPAIRLFRKDSAGMVVAFLHRVFREERRASYGARELVSKLTDFLFAANEPEVRYPRSAREYLEGWTEDGLLRQFYASGEDEATFELTPGGEQALQWVAEMEGRAFVGAESRLLQVFNQLKELAEGTTFDPAERREQLLARRADIDRQLEALERGELDRMDDTRIRERFHLVEDAAQRLLADFRQMEANFRALNARAREELVGYDAARGEVLAEIFSSRDKILATDQGKTFDAFWLFLMNQQRREELRAHLIQIKNLPELDTATAVSPLFRLETDLVDAAIRVKETTDRLVEQLRRFLQSRAFLEGRRLTQLLTDFEKIAIAVKDNPPRVKAFAQIEGKAVINLTMDRAPFSPPPMLRLPEAAPSPGEATDVATDLLYEQLYVDPAELRQRLGELLRERDQISLPEVARAIPLTRGLTELVTYFNIATRWEQERRAVINPARRQEIIYQHGEETRTVDFPETIFLA